MLRSLLTHPAVLRCVGLAGQYLKVDKLLPAAAAASRDRRTSAGFQWAVPLLPIVVAAAGMEKEEGARPEEGARKEGPRTGLPVGYKWESATSAKGEVKWFVRPSLGKAGQANKKTIQIRSASQLLSLHKQGCFLDLKPEDLKHKSKAVVQVMLQHQIEQDERVETVDESEEVGGMSAAELTKKRVGDTRKNKELEEKRARLETYAHKFDQRLVEMTV
jgi:hypothetical protein